MKLTTKPDGTAPGPGVGLELPLDRYGAAVLRLEIPAEPGLPPGWGEGAFVVRLDGAALAHLAGRALKSRSGRAKWGPVVVSKVS